MDLVLCLLLFVAGVSFEITTKGFALIFMIRLIKQPTQIKRFGKIFQYVWWVSSMIAAIIYGHAAWNLAHALGLEVPKIRCYGIAIIAYVGSILFVFGNPETFFREYAIRHLKKMGTWY